VFSRNDGSRNAGLCVDAGPQWRVKEPAAFGKRGHVFSEAVGLLLTPVDVRVGDLDGDCSVGLSDFYMLLEAWGPCPPSGRCTGDLDGDGFVGIIDFLLLLASGG